MDTTTRRTSLGWSDVICPPCQNAILADGCMIDLRPLFAEEKSLVDVFDCPSCRVRARRAGKLRRGARVGTLRPFPYLRAAERDELYAFHEAGHVAVALVTGIRVREVMLDVVPQSDRGQPFEALTVFHEAPMVALRCYLPMRWAGQDATLRQLHRLGRASRANRLDARITGAHDVQEALDAIRSVDPHCNATAVLAVCREYADAVLTSEWSTVTRIAHDLLRHRSLRFSGNTWTSTAAATSSADGALPDVQAVLTKTAASPR